MGTKRFWGITLSALVTCAVPYAGRAASRNEVSAEMRWSLPREGATRLHLSTHGGNIQVMGAETDQLDVRAVKKVRAENDADARALLDQMQIDRHRDGDQWVVEAKWPEIRGRNSPSRSVSFEVRVPRGFRLEAQTGGGNIDVAALGATQVRTGGGNISAHEIRGDLDVNTGGGNIDAIGVGDARLRTGGGNVRARQGSGPIEVNTGGGNIDVDRIGGPVTVNTGGGNIDLRQAESPVKATTGGGNIQLALTRANQGAQVELGTGSGNVDLRLPRDVSAVLLANTGHGRVHLEPSEGVAAGRERSHLETRLGGGQGSVRLRTGSGDIHVRLAGSE